MVLTDCIVDSIWRNLSRRKGFGELIDQCDAEIMEEMHREWSELTQACLLEAAIEKQFVHLVKAQQGPSGAWYYVGLGGNNETLFPSETFSDRSACQESGQKLASQLNVPFEIEVT